MCANLNFADWRTIHHEMGHVVAFMESENLPYRFRHEVNMVFGEGLGDSMVLSVSTIKHLEKVFNMKLVVKPTEAPGWIYFFLNLPNIYIYKLIFSKYIYIYNIYIIIFSKLVLKYDKSELNHGNVKV